jgi:hypothetical protein
MGLIEVYAPHLGRNVKLGGRKKNPHFRAFALGDYLRKSLPDAPTSVDYSPKAAAALGLIDLNNSLGDCVIAAGYHAVGTWTGNASGTPFIPTSEQIIADYSAIGGYVPGNPATDQGCDIGTALSYWASNGFADGSKLLGSLAVDPTNVQEVQQGVFFFEDTWIGMDLPAPWISSMPTGNGFVWDVAGPPVPSNGHCIQAVGYSSSGLLVDTWGLIGTLTWAAVAQYCASSAGGDLFVAVNPDQVASGQSIAPNGVAWADLLADFNSMGGTIAIPQVSAAGGPMTLALAQQAMAAGINSGLAIQTKTGAIQRGAQALAAAWTTSSSKP